MTTKNILLSISMLISGQENMDKSLASLHYFKDALPCEIILIDTGCNAEQRALAEQIADQIFDFTWCNDFAKARNVGLKAARGDWFMYLDDDEWFENPQEILRFFTSGEYKKYNSATYRVRNYMNSAGTIYEEVYVSRMVKRENETEFRGKIHEYFFPYKEPTKSLSDFVHHYGYAYRNEEEKRRHAQRNIKPLKEMMEAQPSDIRWAVQLAQEYMAIKQYTSVIITCEKGLREWHKQNQHYPSEYPLEGCAYAYLLIAYEALADLTSAQSWLEKALQEKGIPEISRAFFYLMAIRIYGIDGQGEQCREFMKKYLEAYAKWKDDAVAIERDTALITTTVFQKQKMYVSLLMGIPSLIEIGDHQLAKKAFDMIDWQDRRMLHQNEHEEKVVNACCSVDYHPVWVEIQQTLVSREDGMKEMYPVFLKQEIAYREQGEDEKLFRLQRLVSELEYSHRYILSTRIFWKAHLAQSSPGLIDKEQFTELFKQLVDEHFKELFEMRTEIWDIADQHGIDLEPMFLGKDFSALRRGLDTWILEASEKDIQNWQHRLATWAHTSDVRYKLFNLKCMEGNLRNSQQMLLNCETMESLLWQCADAILTLYGSCYLDAAFTDALELLPDEIQFAIQLQNLRRAREQGTDRDVLEALRALNDTYEPLNGAIAYYAKLYQEEVHKRNDELSRLAQGLKKNIRILIDAGKQEDARVVIGQLEQFIPGDEELQAFKKELQIK